MIDESENKKQMQTNTGWRWLIAGSTVVSRVDPDMFKSAGHSSLEGKHIGPTMSQDEPTSADPVAILAQLTLSRKGVNTCIEGWSTSV